MLAHRLRRIAEFSEGSNLEPWQIAGAWLFFENYIVYRRGDNSIWLMGNFPNDSIFSSYSPRNLISVGRFRSSTKTENTTFEGLSFSKQTNTKFYPVCANTDSTRLYRRVVETQVPYLVSRLVPGSETNERFNVLISLARYEYSEVVTDFNDQILSETSTGYQMIHGDLNGRPSTQPSTDLPIFEPEFDGEILDNAVSTNGQIVKTYVGINSPDLLVSFNSETGTAIAPSQPLVFNVQGLGTFSVATQSFHPNYNTGNLGRAHPHLAKFRSVTINGAETRYPGTNLAPFDYDLFGGNQQSQIIYTSNIVRPINLNLFDANLQNPNSTAVGRMIYASSGQPV